MYSRVTIFRLDWRFSSFIPIVTQRSVHWNLGGRIDTPSPTNILDFTRLIILTIRRAGPHQGTPLAGTYCWIRKGEVLIRRHRRIFCFAVLRLSPWNVDHGRNYRNCSEHCGKDHPPLSGYVS